MSDFTWLIYFADVVANISATCIFILYVQAVVYVITFMIGLNPRVNHLDEFSRRFLIRQAILSMMCIVLVCFLPSKNMIYAAASYELATRIAANSVPPKSSLALDRWIDGQLSGDDCK